MNIRFSRSLSILLLLFVLCAPCYAGDGTLDSLHFKTVYTKDRFFVTRGSFAVKAGRPRILEVLTHPEHYARWALEGMRRNDPGTQTLPVLLVDAQVEKDGREEILMRVFFDINRFIKKRGISTLFAVMWRIDNSGLLDELILDYRGGSRYIKEGNYSFYLTELRDTIQINYICRVKLAGLLDFFLSKKMYDRNMAYYIKGLSANLAGRLKVEEGEISGK